MYKGTASKADRHFMGLLPDKKLQLRFRIRLLDLN